MERWKLSFALLVMLPFCAGTEVRQLLVKGDGTVTDVNPVCTNETQNPITLIVCKIRTEKNRGEVCRVVYRYRSEVYENKCDPRFKLGTDNQTVFLHLTELTPKDSGNYTCQCSNAESVSRTERHLNITAEEEEDESSSAKMPLFNVVIGVCLFVIITGVILGVINRKTQHGAQLELLTSRPNMGQENIEPYETFLQRQNELYSSTVTCIYANTNDTNVF